MTNSAFQILLNNLTALLKADAALVSVDSLKDHVDPANIRPYHDAAANVPGGLIVYGLAGVMWNKTYRRGECVLSVNCEDPASGSASEALMNRLRTLVSEGTLSSDGCRVAFLREEPNGQMNLAPKLGGYTTRTAFKIKLVGE